MNAPPDGGSKIVFRERTLSWIERGSRVREAERRAR